MRFLYFLGLFCLSLAQLSELERRLVAKVDSREPAARQFLIDVVNINSGTMNFEGVREVHEAFKPRFERLGFAVEWQDGSAFKRAGHFVAKRRGKNAKKRFLLIGHLDTVFEKDSPFQKLTKISDEIYKGPGIADMKGGNVIMLLALEALAAEGALEEMDITVVMTGDEEMSGRPLSLSKKALLDAAETADIALGFENGDGNIQTANISRRSSSTWMLKSTGFRAHSSQIFTKKVGAGAIYEASRILNAFYTELSNEPLLTFNVGTFLGGTDVNYDKTMNKGDAFGKKNVVAQKTIVSGDIRAVSPEQLAKAQKIMKEIVAKHLPNTTAEISFAEGYPPMAPSDGNKRLLSHFSKASEDLGFGKVAAVNPRKAGAADISFVANHVDMALDGLGLGGENDHSIQETGEIKSLEIQAKRSAILMYRLSKKKRSSSFYSVIPEQKLNSAKAINFLNLQDYEGELVKIKCKYYSLEEYDGLVSLNDEKLVKRDDSWGISLGSEMGKEEFFDKFSNSDFWKELHNLSGGEFVTLELVGIYKHRLGIGHLGINDGEFQLMALRIIK